MIGNPIFRREFIASARSPRNVFLIGLYLFSLAAVLLIMWPEGGVLSAVSDTGKQIFTLFFNTNLTLLIMLVPAFAAGAITYEKENDTFPALFTTLLTPFEILVGKLGAAISMMVLLVVLSTPIASICALTGGVNLVFILKTTALLLIAAISYGLLGLMCSALVSRSSTAIVMNYALIMVLAGGSWLPGKLLGNLVGGQAVWDAIRCFSPYDVMFYLLYPEKYSLTTNATARLTSVELDPFTIYALFSLVLSVIALTVFAYGVSRPAAESAAPKGEVYDDAKKSRKRRLRWPFYLIDPLKRKKPIRAGANPVFVTEMRGKLFANPKFVLRTVSAIFIISLVILTLIALQYGDTLNPEYVRLVAIVFQIGVVAMLAPGVSSGLITDEIANNTLVALRMTPLKPFTMVMGKLKATFFYAMIFIVSSFFVLLSMAYLENQQVFPEGSMLSGAWWSALWDSARTLEWWGNLWSAYRRVCLWVVILLLSAVTFLAGGLFASSIAKRTSLAAAIAYAITTALCVISFAPIVMVGRFASGFAFFVLSLNPIAAAMQITSDAFSDFPGLWQANIVALCALTGFFLFAATIRAWYLFRVRD